MNETSFRAVGDKRRLVDRVVDEIERMIVNSELLPDSKLPPERELADQLGVSRTVVRGAIHTLVAKGLLDSKQGVGTTVRKMTSDSVSQSLNLLLQTSTEDITFEHLYQIRALLEVEIAGLATQFADSADVETLREAVADMETAQNDPQQLAEKDVVFHRTLAQMSRNPLLVVFIDMIRDLMREYSVRVIPHINPTTDILPDHHNIVTQVAAGDVAAARQAMRDHIEQILFNYQQVFGSTEFLLNGNN